MKRRQGLPAAARELLDDQHGVITTAQLVGCGLSERVVQRLVAGWEHPSRGIHLTRAATWESALTAGLLRGGGDAVVGGLAACFLEEAVRDAPGAILIWAPERRAGFTVGEWRVTFRRGSAAPYGAKEPPRTAIDESLLDVAATSDERDTVATIISAFARRVAEPGRLLAALAGRTHQRHREVIEALCHPSAKGVHSLIEWVFLRDVIRAHQLPAPELQVSKAAGRVDEHFRQWRTIVELDGKRDHGLWSRDMLRDKEHLLDDGSVTLRHGLANILDQPCAAAAQVERRLRGQGWGGRIVACGRCRKAS